MSHDPYKWDRRFETVWSLGVIGVGCATPVAVLVLLVLGCVALWRLIVGGA